MQRREGRALVLIDIAVPRDVEPEVDELPNTFRFDLDALNTIVRQSISRRQKEVPAVEQLVDAEVAGFMRWWESLASGPVIRDLHRAFEAVRETEFGKNAKRFRTDDREQLDVFSRNLVRKILSGPTMEIKHYGAGDPIAMERLAAIRQVFGLDERVEADNDDASG
jgi:glutamyl-tRNA reductase